MNIDLTLWFAYQDLWLVLLTIMSVAGILLWLSIKNEEKNK